MISLPYPPPKGSLNPKYYNLSVGSSLLRIFNPSDHNATALTFRRYGPILRFDHHIGQGKGEKREACHNTDRGIYYTADKLSCCVVEVFGDWGFIVDPLNAITDYYLASPILTRDLTVLDLRRKGAMGAGTKAAISKTRERPLSQSWARYFYENPVTYATIDGLLYLNFHNDEETLALFERAQDTLQCLPNRVWRLDNKYLRSKVLKILRDHSLT